MRSHIHFDPTKTSAPLMDRMAARMILSHCFDHGWVLEHLDVKSTFLHEEYKYKNQVFIREPQRADGTYKHGNTIEVLRQNLYGNPSGSFYYMEGLIKFLHNVKSRSLRGEVMTGENRNAKRRCNRCNFNRLFSRHGPKGKSDDRCL